MRLLGLYALIPMTGLLTVSYFVLFANRMVQEGSGIKTFGKVVAVLLWIAAALVLSAGIWVLSTGGHPAWQMHGMMQGQ
jgi:predicted permease